MKSHRGRWPSLILLILFAWMATGGTFTCTTDDDDHHHHKSQQKSSSSP